MCVSSSRAGCTKAVKPGGHIIVFQTHNDVKFIIKAVDICKCTWTNTLKGKTCSETATTSKTIFSRQCVPSEVTD